MTETYRGWRFTWLRNGLVRASKPRNPDLHVGTVDEAKPIIDTLERGKGPQRAREDT